MAARKGFVKLKLLQVLMLSLPNEILKQIYRTGVIRLFKQP